MNLLVINTFHKWERLTPLIEDIISGFKDNNHRIFVLSDKQNKFSELSSLNKKSFFYKINKNNILSFTFKILSVIRKYHVNLVLCCDKYDYYIGSITAKLNRIPCLRIIDSYIDLQFKSLFDKLFERQFITHNILTACFVYNQARKTNKSLNKKYYSVIYTGKKVIIHDENETQKLRKKWACDTNNIVIGMNTTLNDFDGISDMLYVLNDLSEEYPDLRLVISGIGNKKHKLLELCTKLNITEKVIFTGFTKEPEINALAYDICINTSKLGYLPECIFDYLNAGKPIISVNIDGITEVLQDTCNSLLFPYRDTQTLKKHLITILTNKNTRAYISNNALRTSKDFTYQKMITNYENLFCRFIKS